MVFVYVETCGTSICEHGIVELVTIDPLPNKTKTVHLMGPCLILVESSSRPQIDGLLTLCKGDKVTVLNPPVSVG